MGKLYENIISREATNRDANERILSAYDQILKEGKVAGWIAMYGGKKLEIKKGEAKDLWGAKQIALKNFKVPKSKQGLLAIEPAYDD
jgi:hypothetical protein